MNDYEEPLEDELMSNVFIKAMLERTHHCFQTDADDEMGSDYLTLYYNSGLMATLTLQDNTINIAPEEDEFCDSINEEQMERDLKEIIDAIKNIDPKLNIEIK